MGRMNLPLANQPLGDTAAGKLAASFHDPPHHTANFGLLASYMVAMRTGWIFKTESIIMPAVLDVIGGAGWLRGCLPMLNRFGQSVPPLLVSDRIRSTPLKKRWLTSTTGLMGLCFLALSAVWTITGGKSSGWLPLLFLAIYAVFFSATGINMLLLNTLKGKLIRTRRRGLLDLFSNVVGASVAVTCAWILLTLWLGGSGPHPLDVPGTPGVGDAATSTPDFKMIFLFTGLIFVVAAMIGRYFFEVPDTFPPRNQKMPQILASTVTILKTDHNFRKLAIVGMTFGMALTLFPHYQALGRARLTLGLTALIPWVIAQNIGTAVFSIPTGWAADRFGNRRVLNFLMLALCVAPALAIFLAAFQQAARGWFVLVFGLLGLTPVTIRTLNNYTLEIAGHGDHPRYLSTLSLCVAVPTMLCSALIGLLVDLFSFELVFVLATLVILAGWLLTFQLIEPRSHLPETR